ncbi:MAG: 3-deoxy-D-manno-octulosonic acid transferase [Bacteroidaceae bacterium]|nr:3-deoxy-D-manno-octulosonic acid transferase [Bacteroidaceae bacterium]
MYSLAIYIYMFCVNIVAIFNRKARLLMVGHSKTYDILRRGISEGDNVIWFHAASLGEFEQGRPLIEKIRENHPEYKILLTFFSPSGYEVRKDYKGADVICYLPFDTKLNARKFMRIAKPKMAFFIKYEFWQNYLTALHRRSIPVYSVASIFRPNQIFFRWYGHKYRNVLRTFAHLFVQNQESVDLLRTLDITNTSIVGDTRLDRVLQIKEQAKELPLCEAFAKSPLSKSDSSILVAGSSWQPDEDIIINYFNSHPNQRLIIAPHVVNDSHLAEIEGKLQRPAVRYTQATAETAAEAHCLIIDCYGLLSSIYRYATIAYVGGGFGAGIHNVPEAAVYGVPVIIGPNNKKFREARKLIDLGGCFEINNSDDYVAIIDMLTSQPDSLTKASTASADYIKANAGAVDMIYNYVFKG